jgi:hypothetical protein
MPGRQAAAKITPQQKKNIPKNRRTRRTYRLIEQDLGSESRTQSPTWLNYRQSLSQGIICCGVGPGAYQFSVQ